MDATELANTLLNEFNTDDASSAGRARSCTKGLTTELLGFAGEPFGVEPWRNDEGATPGVQGELICNEKLKYILLLLSAHIVPRSGGASLT